MTLTAHPSGPLRGIARVPGDKSISHRALMLGAVAEGETIVEGLLEADDVLRTAAALRAFGAEIERDERTWRVRGGDWAAPSRALYMGNAGTGARLLMGLAAGRQLPCTFTGDASLRGRPMARITDPLVRMGAQAVTRGGQLPVSLAGGRLSGITYRLPKPSAQVKSAVLLAGLGAEGVTTVEEPVPTRDHTERMLRAFGVHIGIEPMEAGLRVSVEGGQRLRACPVTVPADPSSAAFPIVAALIGEGAEVTIPGVMTNPRRTGLLDVLVSMGARFERRNERDVGGETVCDLAVRSSPLRAVHVMPEQVPDMVDEIPILAVAAAFAEGITRIEGLEELRVKESDRLAATLALLQANGVPCEAGEDWLKIEGGTVPGGGTVATLHDHRIAMAALVLGSAAHSPVAIDDPAPIDTSFPSFRSLMEGLGVRFEG
ncbi:3-phosphoshikimate 1-carboxyvinyltransferase [Parvularcula dongshanensis]|uniref:3-phosphoshikimate 1-carboxyvinyltransferase n=1 Tax=Parvularcula dongshanensis TaxID=1173995 RepID=A0A840I6W1_9PROT|nr:3-phosphoshikimate 1-carboxyvinyltransferase [Parvularcula dongshanensis]MBB4660055.1 3-phosphoshikimate 1-carboxyvinyltransferase [Parvularcula dongshanensis]